MEWISVKDALPTKYEYYLVLSDKSCDKCLAKEHHSHKLNFRRYKHQVALWSEKQLDIVNHYQAKGDHSWDFCANDRFTECSLENNQITHWMPFPNYPEYSIEDKSSIWVEAKK